MLARALKNGHPLRGSGVALTVGAAGLLLILASWDGLVEMAQSWSREEYSHGYLIPIVAAFLLARGLARAEAVLEGRRWPGPAIVALGGAMAVLGQASMIRDLSIYGFFVGLVGLAVSVLGHRRVVKVWAPVAYLLFMVPLPQFVYLKLSAEMQLLSSELGAGMVRMLGIPVFLDGNVIDLGNYSLQVAEACSGLRYLFPLMSFGFLFAMLFSGARWQKVVLFLSSLPIAVIMNSVRIAVIAVLADDYGIAEAEGFLHFFEGWVIFLACVALLFAAAWLLDRLGRWAGRQRAAIDLRPPDARALRRLAGSIRGVSATLVASTVLALSAGVGQLAPFGDAHANLVRDDLSAFPAEIGTWRGQPEALEREIRQVLAADDYLVSGFVANDSGAPVSLFIAYYATQTDGRAAHSPEICIPGGGWEIVSLSSRSVDLESASEAGLRVNRAIIQKGRYRQLVYYWFEQRGRRLVNEYVVKWYILWDALTRKRTDGALVRLVTPLIIGEDEPAADARLARFLRGAYPVFGRFIPA